MYKGYFKVINVVMVFRMECFLGVKMLGGF